MLHAADAVVQPRRVTGGEDVTADGTQHDPLVVQAGAEHPPDRDGTGAQPDDDQPRVAGTGRAPAGQAVSPLEGRPVSAADRGLGAGGADGGADAGTGARRSRAPISRRAERLPRVCAPGAPRTTTTSGRVGGADPLRGAARGVPASGLGRDPAVPVRAAAPGDALLPGLPPQAQPLDLGALHRRYAPGDALPRARRLLPGARLGAVGAGLRQHEDGHQRPGCGRAAGVDARPAATGGRVRLPSPSLRPGCGEPERERRVAGQMGQIQPGAGTPVRGRRRPGRADDRLAGVRQWPPLGRDRRGPAGTPVGGGDQGWALAPERHRLRAPR